MRGGRTTSAPKLTPRELGRMLTHASEEEFGLYLESRLGGDHDLACQIVARVMRTEGNWLRNKKKAR